MTARQKLSSTSIAILVLLGAALNCRAQAVGNESYQPERSSFAIPQPESAFASGTEQAAARTPSNRDFKGVERVFNFERANSRPRLSPDAFRSWEQLNEGEKADFFRRQLEAPQTRLVVAGEDSRAGVDGHGPSGAWKRLAFVPSRGPIPLGQWINYGGMPDWNREHLTQAAAPDKR